MWLCDLVVVRILTIGQEDVGCLIDLMASMFMARKSTCHLAPLVIEAVQKNEVMQCAKVLQVSCM